jgi:hypothetical protein
VIREDSGDQESDTEPRSDIVDILQGDGEWYGNSDTNDHKSHTDDAVVLFVS